MGFQLTESEVQPQGVAGHREPMGNACAADEHYTETLTSKGAVGPHCLAIALMHCRLQPLSALVVHQQCQTTSATPVDRV